MIKLITANRASTILYNFIISNDKNKATWLLPTNVCHFVPATILKAGAKIEILDISKEDLCINKEQVLLKLKNKEKEYSGIIYVRSFGINNNADPFFSKIKSLSNNLLLVDDKCLAMPEINEKINPLVDLELFSTGYSKYVDLGYGGFAKLNKNCNYSELLLDYNKQDEVIFSNYFKDIVYNRTKINDKKLQETINLNWLDSSNINNADAYFVEIKNALKKIKKNKEIINKIYEKSLVKNVEFKESSNNWRYNILVNKREEILETLNRENLFASKHYYPLSKIFKAKETPVWNYFYSKVINLFNDFRYSTSQAKKTVSIINKIENK